MIRQPFLPSFDDQLRHAFRVQQSGQHLTQREAARFSRLTLPVISRWSSVTSMTLRFDSAERLARALNQELRTTRMTYSSRDSNRELSFDEQLKSAIDPARYQDLARATKIPLTRLHAWERFGNSKLLLREVFKLCTLLELDLLVPVKAEAVISMGNEVKCG